MLLVILVTVVITCVAIWITCKAVIGTEAPTGGVVLPRADEDSPIKRIFRRPEPPASEDIGFKP